MKLHATRAYIDPTPVPKMPAGLVELMEGLSREVLKNNPSEVYEFCANHMRNLLVMRDGKPPEKYLTLEQKINKANFIIKRRAEERRQNFDNNKRLHAKQDDMQEQSFDNKKISNTVKVGNLINSKEDSILRQENENIPEHNVKVEDNNNSDTAVSEKDNRDEGTNESLIEKNQFDHSISANLQQLTKDDVLNNSVSDSSKDVLNCSHIAEHAKDIGENKSLESVDKIDVSGKHYAKINIEQAATEGRIDNSICPNIEEDTGSEVVQEVDIKLENAISSEIVHSIGTDVSNEEFSTDKVVEEEIESKQNKDNFVDKHSTSELNYNVHNTGNGHNTAENLNLAISNVKTNIEVDNDENKDNKIQEKLTEIDVEHNIKDVGKSCDTKNAIKTEVAINTISEVEVNPITLEHKENINKENVEGTSDILQNQANITEPVDGASRKNNFNNSEENEIKSKSNVEDAVSKNEEKKQHLETTNKLCQSKSVDQILEGKSDDHMEKVVMTNEQQIHEMTDCDTDVTAKRNNKTKENSDMDNFINDQKNSELVKTIESEQHGQDNTNDANSNQYNSQIILKEFDESVSNNSHEPETTEFKSPKTMDLETAAITIQKVFRIFLFRSKTSSFEEHTNIEFNVLERESDIKGKSDFTIHNQNKDRRVMGISRMDTVLQTVNEEKSLSLSTDDSSTISSAATIIQAHIRGFLCRNRLNRNKAISSASLNASNNSSPMSSEDDLELIKNKTVLNIHIVPEGGQFLSRDESILTSIELSLDGSPPASANLHPLGYDKSERRKQLKREDAIQSISPPSYNSRLSEEQDSVKELLINDAEVDKAEKIDSEMPIDSKMKIAISIDGIISKNSLEEKISSDENLKDNIILRKEQEHIKEALIKSKEIEVKNNISVMASADSQISIAISNDDILPKIGLEEEHSFEENLQDNSRQSEEHTSVKDFLFIEDKTEIKQNVPIFNDGVILKESDKRFNNENGTSEEQKSVKEEVLNGKKDIQQNIGSEKMVDSELNKTAPHDHVQKNNIEEIECPKDSAVESSGGIKSGTVTEISSDELDVVTPFQPTEEKLNDTDKPKLLHSGEFHDVVLPTKVSRNDTSVVSDFHNVLVYFLVWNNS